MRILFLHPNFPAQFRHLATTLAKEKGNQVVFGTSRKEGEIPGVYKALYNPSRTARPETHHYVRNLENAVLQGQAVYRLAEQLKSEGFIPDTIYGHSGWGPTLLMKDAFPKSKLLCYFEWFYHSRGSDADFDPSEPLTADDEARIRLKNTPILTDLYSCDRGLSPTYWQRHQFPPEYHSKISVLHDGIDTEFFKPSPGAKLVLPRINLDLSQVEEIVTYVARGMEPYRGFPQLIETIAILQERRPQCHFVIVGENRVAYGKNLPDGKTYKDAMLEKFPLDLSRVHFTGYLPYSEYLQVLQASSVHVYLTRPFVLSWSMLESLSTGCLVVGSSTAPVQEIIEDGVNGLLVDFFSPPEIASRVEEVLDHPDRMASLRAKARETIVNNYDLAQLLPKHLQWIQQDVVKTFAGGSLQKPQAKSKKSKSFLKEIEKLDLAGSRKDRKENVSGSSEIVLQVNNKGFTGKEIITLLDKYQLLPQLIQQLIIDSAIAPFTCTQEEENIFYQQFLQQNQLRSETEVQAWLQNRGMNAEQLKNLVIRNLKIEKFKRSTWQEQLEPYFLQRKQQLEQVKYQMLRTTDSNLVEELYSRLKEGKDSFSELARKYSQGQEAQSGGKVGPVLLSNIHPSLAQALKNSKPGEILSPISIEEWFIIVRLESFIPVELDEPMRQKLLNELFANWLQQQVRQNVKV